MVLFIQREVIGFIMMKTKTSLLAIIILVSTFTLAQTVKVHAASESDMNTVAPQDQTGKTLADARGQIQKMVLTATSNSQVAPGKSATLVITAHTPDGVAINAADIKIQSTNYNNHTEKINTTGATDETGDLAAKVAIPDSAKTGQWLVIVQGNKTGFTPDEISTGIAVTEFKGKDFTSG
jgi:hypothetical protein